MAESLPRTAAASARRRQQDPPAPGGQADHDGLVERAVAGDSAAFDDLVQRHRRRVSGLAYRLLGWHQDVDDVVQEVFLTMLTQLNRFRGEAGLATWLTTVTVNKCRNWRRRQRLAAAVGRLLRRTVESPETEPPGQTGPYSMDRETLSRVRRVVASLPDRYREVVVLRYLEDLPVAEIGRVLRIAPNTVEVRLSRARKRLRDRLAEITMERSR